MKKLFLMAAFAGLLGSSAVANTFGDDKKAEASAQTEEKATEKK